MKDKSKKANKTKKPQRIENKYLKSLKSINPILVKELNT